jgi:broad specificity phosphatase PhoE
MNKHTDTTYIYLIRHATPDWKRTDIPYDIPPGPPLIHQGEVEALQLGEFIKQTGIKKLYYSPLERAKRTAEISANVADISIEEELGIAEWRTDENDQQFASRFMPAWNRAVNESGQQGPIGLVTHGGPVRFMLQTLGLTTELIETYKKQFDQQNPLPPAGVWVAEKSNGEERWSLNLVFVPNTKEVGATRRVAPTKA